MKIELTPEQVKMMIVRGVMITNNYSQCTAKIELKQDGGAIVTIDNYKEGLGSSRTYWSQPLPITN